MGPFWGYLGPSWGHLGPPRGPCWEVLGTKSDAPAEAKRSFSYLQALFVHLGRVQATTLSTLSALPVPMLGQVWPQSGVRRAQKWCSRRGETFIFTKSGVPVEVYVKIMVFLRFISLGLCKNGAPVEAKRSFSHFGVIKWCSRRGESLIFASWIILGLSWSYLGASWGLLGSSWGHLGLSWCRLIFFFAKVKRSFSRFDA